MLQVQIQNHRSLSPPRPDLLQFVFSRNLAMQMICHLCYLKFKRILNWWCLRVTRGNCGSGYQFISYFQLDKGTRKM